MNVESTLSLLCQSYSSEGKVVGELTSSLSLEEEARPSKMIKKYLSVIAGLYNT